MRIEHVMTKPLAICRPRDSLNQAAHLMWEYDCGAIPVVDDDGDLIGIITDRDICMAAYTQGRALDKIPVLSAMAQKVFSCRPHQTLQAAEALMKQRQVRRIPIVDDTNRPVGMLSLSDLARYAQSTAKNRMNEEVSQTLAAISQPHGDDAIRVAESNHSPAVGEPSSRGTRLSTN